MDRDRIEASEPLPGLLAVISTPRRGRRRLPWLLGRLDAADEGVRAGAAWALCRVASDDPGVVPYLVRRLVDRLDGSAATEVRLLVDYLGAAYPDRVEDALDDLSTDEARWAAGGLDATGTVDNRRTSTDRSVDRRTEPGSDRARLPGEDVVRSGAHTAVGRGPGRLGSRNDDDQDPEGTAGEDGDDSDGDDDSEGENDGTDRRPGSIESGTRPARDGWAASAELSVIKYESRFDRLTVLAGRRRRRYADVYRTLAVREGEELPVGLALFHRPEESGDGYVDDLSRALERWSAVDDHGGVTTIHDWGTEPRPWATVEYADLTLADRGRLDPETARWNAERIAAALARTHENGVVHGGVDPGNLAYYGNVIDEDERQPPLLTNVGLMPVIRRYFDPTTRLDPRYAAPEYYDRSYGRIDHATDVYGLGAVVYRLFTGEPPYDGEYDDVRRNVLGADPPRPSAVADVPDGVDDVVGKAMATRKLRRYESVSHVLAELRAAGGDHAG